MTLSFKFTLQRFSRLVEDGVDDAVVVKVVGDIVLAVVKMPGEWPVGGESICGGGGNPRVRRWRVLWMMLMELLVMRQKRLRRRR